MDHKYDVFISYSRKDTAVADQICKAFADAGITYFIDRQGIGGGMEFPAVLAKAIRESQVFLFLGSRNSYDSKFTQSEIVYAFNKKQKQDIIPYIIDGSSMPDELEFTFSSINWRRIEEHPIDTVLVDDVLRKTGKQRPAQQPSPATPLGPQGRLPEQEQPSPVTQHSTLNTQHSTLNTQHSTLNTQHSTFNTQHSTFTTPHLVTRIGLQVVNAVLYATIVMAPMAMLGGTWSPSSLALLIVTPILAAVAIYLARRITKGDKWAYYALAAATAVEVVAAAIYDPYLGVGVALILGVAFFLFTQLLKIKKDGHSLWQNLK